MKHPVILFIVIGIFVCFIINVVEAMIRDNNVILRFLGYAIAIIMAIGVFVLILNLYFGIDLRTIFAL